MMKTSIYKLIDDKNIDANSNSDEYIDVNSKQL